MNNDMIFLSAGYIMFMFCIFIVCVLFFQSNISVIFCYFV